ncbi:hypothetical protein BIY24_08870 [Halobacteriovorax marinus]|uniref:hypothetical protein n=1 Tax=Halobacteriovorax marinus TaxID=97084 RepID=UPI000BC32EB6|nr:hypothetical protein [Halobacteriovorax marinus]ATH08060.1 hypothetical protein BIY24_08870 [Halobacteriovorax marinus]
MLKNSANNYRKGDQLEREISRDFHRSSRAVLISAKVLRERSMGQVDLARVRGELLEVAEVKNSSWITHKQINRLRASTDFLGMCLNLSAKFTFIHK